MKSTMMPKNNTNRSRIRDALMALTSRSNVDAFVIVEHQLTAKFVQFSGSVSEPLMLDLPHQTLSELEFHRAVTFFRKFGVEGREFELFDHPDGKVVGQQYSFNMEFGSVDDAVDVTIAVFEQVYLASPEAHLMIIEN